MPGKKPELILMIAFFLIILSVPVFWLVRGPNPYQRSWLEGRYLTDFAILNRGFYTALKDLVHGDPATVQHVFKTEFIDRQFQKDFEDAASDQFPFRFYLIQAEKALERQVINLTYVFLPDPAIPADMRSEFYVTRDVYAIIYGPNPFNESTFRIIDARIGNYTALINTYPEMNFYVYYIERIQNTQYHPLDSDTVKLERGQYYQYFIDHKPAELTVQKLDINSFEDHLKYFYHTDHHWNVFGILAAYQEIYDMLAANFSAMSEKLVFDDFVTFNDLQFRGSEARRTFYSEDEPFTVVDYRLPPYKVYENGQEIVYGGSSEYLTGIYPHDPYFNHYEGYYGGDKALLEFVFDNPSNRNLLVIGNSYDNALLPLLASHYHHTYDVDLRYYQDFSLSAFLVDHPVDDVLVIGENSPAFASKSYTIQP